MFTSGALLKSEASELPDDHVIDRVLHGETALYELLVRRYNQQVYRAVRAVLRNDDEAEDVMQDAYVRAFQHLAQFEHRASFKTWITRIAIHEALARLHKSQRIDTQEFDENALSLPQGNTAMSPEQSVAVTESRELLEQAILSLPVTYRTVIMLRDVQELTTAEAASALELTEEAVKVRLHRARALLRRELFSRVGATSSAAFQFHAPRCDRVTAGVMLRISSF